MIREAQQVITEGVPRLLLLGTPRPVWRGRAGRDDRGAHRLPERGRAGGLHRAGAARAAPGHRGPLADGRRRWPTCPGRWAGAPRCWTAGRSRRPTRTRARWWWWPPRATGTRRPSSRRSRPGPPTWGWSGRPSGARECWATSRTGACRRTSWTGSGCPPGLDLGRTSHREIAVAILAELVQLRASGELALAATGERCGSAAWRGEARRRRVPAEQGTRGGRGFRG